MFEPLITTGRSGGFCMDASIVKVLALVREGAAKYELWWWCVDEDEEVDASTEWREPRRRKPIAADQAQCLLEDLWFLSIPLKLKFLANGVHCEDGEDYWMRLGDWENGITFRWTCAPPTALEPIAHIAERLRELWGDDEEDTMEFIKKGMHDGQTDGSMVR